MDSLLSSDDETRRLAALASYNVLDSLPEQEYDDIVQLAAQLCEMPIALITLVDDHRQWFKANQGLSIQQTPREQSFCAHNLNGLTGSLIVKDARLDDRFSHNPLVTDGPHIVFYAGVPLVDADGHTLGSLCVIDQQSRQLTPAQLSALERLARQAMSLLTLRKTNQALQKAQDSILRQRTDIDFALQAADLGVWEVDQATNLVVWDDRCRALFGIDKGNPLSYEQAVQYIHPDDVERVDRAVQWAINPASDGHYDQTYRTIGASDGLLRWVRFQGKAYLTVQGKVDRFAGVAQEITKQVLERRAADETELKLRSVLEQAPAAIAISMLVGPELIITAPNQTFMDTVGKGNDIAGKSLRTVMPELESQPFLQIFDQILATGQPFQAYDMPVFIVQQGQPQHYFFNVTFSPVRDQNDQIYAILGLSFDVTQQVLDRRALQKQATMFQNAVDTAQLGIWAVDLASGTTHLSERHVAMFGTSTNTTFEEAIKRITPADQNHVVTAFRAATQPGSPGKFDVEYTAIHGVTGQPHAVRAVGQTYFDQQGQALRVEGTTQDITSQRLLQTTLEELVQARTQEMLRANQDLTRSNNNLQQFAYVASHDLQEPLRKIQAFASLINQQLADHADESVRDYLARISAAGERMSMLISDLLTYSRVSTRQQVFDSVSLGAVLTSVLTVLDWEIRQKGAQLTVAELPSLKGDPSQLSQLFQNLLTNALKFVRPGQVPQIRIRYAYCAQADLPPGIYPAPSAAFYHRISVADNGVGFDEKYVDRIFQVFQRLHGKNQFPGTGVGLAICQRVVENHGGAITASSQPGQGATFYVFLPA